MIRTHWMSGLGPLMMVAALVGCSTSTAPTENEKEDVASEEAVADEGQTVKNGPVMADKRKHEPRDFGMRGGPMQILKRAVQGLELSAEQKATIDKAFAEATPEAASEGKGEDFKAFFEEVAKEIRANSIDEAGLLTKASALEKPATDPMRASMAKSLQIIHDTLTPEQRAKLASDLDGKLSAMHRAGPGKGFGGDRAGKKDHEEKSPLGFVLRGVDVTEEQKASIQKALDAAGLAKSGEEMKQGVDEMEAKMKAVLEAFKGDKFDAAALLPTAPAMKGDHLQVMIKSLKIVVPLLDEAQRNALADRVQKGMDMKGKHGPRGERPHGKREKQREESFD